jgi:nucleoside-diphosphate kinase
MTQTFAFLKPDAVARPYVAARTLDLLRREDVSIDHCEQLTVSPDLLADHHYAEHAGKFFFDWLVKYVSAGPILAMTLSGDDVCQTVRDLLGDSLVEDAAPETIRGQYGITGGLNVMHASATPEEAAIELGIWEDVMTEEVPIDPDAFIDRHIGRLMGDPGRYKELSFAAADGDERARERLWRLLDRESPLGEETVDALTEAFVENARLR